MPYLKGQYFSFDAVVASVIFILALVTLLSAWHSLRTALDHQSSPMHFEALRIADTLLTPGSGESLCADMRTLGLAISWNDRRIDDQKLESCSQLSRSPISGKFGTIYHVGVFVNGMYAFGEPVDGTTALEITRVRKVASLYNATTGQSEPVALDVFVFR